MPPRAKKTALPPPTPEANYDATIKVGTSGFSYKEWVGSFYPTGLPGSRMLSYYAALLPTVEINATFYRMPKGEMLGAWVPQVPKGFVFILKAPQRVSHHKKLVDCKDDMDYFARAAAELGDALGPVLVQLPPYFAKATDVLERFLADAPTSLRYAFEFRHGSWLNDAVYDVLRKYNAALVAADTDDAKEAAPLLSLTDFGYLRLRWVMYDDAAIAQWAASIKAMAWPKSYVFFKHEDAGTGPAFAKKLIAELGV